MKWAFELLELPMDADAASVKRAYARLLRTTRPDENPEGFQRLHAAYKTALTHVNRPSVSPAHVANSNMDTAKTGNDVIAIPVELTRLATTTSASAQVASTPNAERLTVNIPALADEVIRTTAEIDDGKVMLQWLQNRHEFWSIITKQQTGQLVIHRLFETPQAMSSDSLDAMLHFFDLDHVLSGINPLALQQLRQRQRIWWELIPRNHRHLALRMRQMWGQQPDVALLGKDVALLQSSFRWSRVLRTALQLGRGRELGRLAQTLSNNGRFDALPPSIDREHTRFWLSAAAVGGPMTQQRFAIGSLRAAVVALCIALSSLALLLLLPGFSTSGRLSAMAAIPPTVAIGIFALWLVYAGCAWFDHWQGLPEPNSSRRPWLRRLAIPAICLCNLALYAMTGSHYVEWLALLTCVFAVRRFRRRISATSKLALQIRQLLPALFFILIIVGSPLLQTVRDGGSATTYAATIITFCLWFADMWRYRAHLHPKLARH
ncbi:J domain-containing protein [Dyella caseinilytica]|uniref:J domain-containing protein n=1 Tax=Dyella caseinilytica TaxID=1849581 RepID=A0ABX7GXH2_9GAMM|nr:J domain-containing protein [Dyella caseinilytica]QRN54718.1 J domain-containing protein [Dyella caseinilytica]GFZ96292.1 hypothetical protein GCM10011408_15870 [Dyella caseinilytica]